MRNIIILTDTRQQKEEHILKEFDKQGIMHIRTTLKSADYMAIEIKENKPIIDFTILIDTKKDIEEIAHNLCNSQEHERIKREIERARELGCKDFIFLICSNTVKSSNDLERWKSTRTKVQGKVLIKIMKTMKERYGCRFIFIPKKECGKKIIELLQK